MSLPQIILILVAFQRLAELIYAKRNSKRLLAAGAVEVGARHYPLFVLLHGSWLAALFLLVPGDAKIDWWLIGIFVLLQVGRIWVIATLGRFWTTRIITQADAPLVTEGPYRFYSHPNYAIVLAEIAVLPLAFGAWEIAALFSILNLALLAWRIHVETTALAPRGRVTALH